jgi:hypothetical protein
MGQSLQSFRFELIPQGDGKAELRIFLVPIERGIVGKITLGEIAEVIRYFEGVQDKMMREKTMKKQNTKEEL